MYRPSLFLLISAILSLTGLAAGCSEPREPANLALRRPAFHSSSIDFNATAQLAVDGIVENAPPCWVEVRGSGGKRLDKREHDLAFEPRQWTSIRAEGPAADLSVITHGFTEAVDRISMTLAAELPDGVRRAAYTAELQMRDGEQWRGVQVFKGIYPGGRLTLDWNAPQRTDAAGWRFTLDMPGAAAIEWQEWRLYREGRLLPMLTSEHFSSVWVPESGGAEWLAVDLGSERTFSEVRLHWLNAPSAGRLQTGRDSSSWSDLAALDGTARKRIDTLQVRGRGRWVRLQLDRSVDGKPYILSEMEVIGRDKSPNNTAPAVSRPVTDGQRIDLDEGWQLARLPQAADPAAWIPATVPGTVLASYLDNHFLPDPNFGDNQDYISDSYFNASFIYRCRFALPEGYLGNKQDEHVRLNFDGINWKAGICLNGSEVGRIEGAFTDASFDVTDLLQAENLLEVTVCPPAHPGAAKGNTLERCATNGGVLGADNPTFHASVGWDWIPTIRGRNMGIWNDVFLQRSGPVRIVNPRVTSQMSRLETLPPQFDTTSARVTLGATLVNDSCKDIETMWEGSFGEYRFSQAVQLKAGTEERVSATLDIDHPKLWWPNGYGEAYLYPVRMRAEESDAIAFEAGIREFTYDAADGNLRIWINGRRFVGRGGNWGFSESNLRYRASDYQTAMELHRHENFNMVRNWVGMVGDAEFYEAADRCGILVWQDFWLANPSDGPDPDDEVLFMANAENMMLRIRNHPSLLLWCGRNEGYPPASLDKALRELVAREDPASFYLSSSADDYVSGRGPYRRLPSQAYYRIFESPGQEWESVKFHSERGMPNFPNYESLVQMMPEDCAWPPNRMWGVHDFALRSAQGGESFIAAVDSFFGPSSDARTFAARAQWVNYEGYRAMFESRSAHRRGLLLWMSHPAWPSMAFCTYDWFLDCTASYYACRKACEPLHIQWNPDKGQVEVVNYNAGEQHGLLATAEVFDLDGKPVSRLETSLDAAEDSTFPCFTPEFPESEVCFLRLELLKDGQLLSRNDYVLPRQEDNLQSLNSLPQVQIEMACPDDGCITVENRSEAPVLMLHLQVLRSDGSRILPSFWSDNYIHLMPGEKRTLSFRTQNGEKAASVRVSGFNVPEKLFKFH